MSKGSSDLIKRLEQAQKDQVEFKKRLAKKKEGEGSSIVLVSSEEQPKKTIQSTKRSMVQYQRELFSKECDGVLRSANICPGNEFPTPLTRLPIFSPSKRSKDNRKNIDSDNALTFETPWGKGRKHGPPLTVYDEDTLIAILRSRQKRLQGTPNNMPLYPSSISSKMIFKEDGNHEVAVHFLVCTLSDIISVCGDSDGGHNRELRLASIKRLGATVLEFDKESAEKFNIKGTQVKIVDIAWDIYQEDSVLLMQFPPLIADWLDTSYTYIDWKIRQQLSDTGKALHRFFSGQDQYHYKIGVEKLLRTIGYERENKYFLRDLRQTMDDLKELGWVSTWEITGTGRKIPHKIEYYRPRNIKKEA